ncbi:MAG: hypothetical protein KF794_12825 [Xanthobacteraceae bacterium]|nr:hypothetical protein [Xanthobacteraceae bacterium]QYK44638.1 MAG: hypothetical protein KF794_12825 [Xanthobacteraceae bacterium]HMN51542.1 hypothetical protein [Xanthobacteraceae bacterium]
MQLRKFLPGFLVLAVLCTGAVAGSVSHKEESGSAPVSLPHKSGNVIAQRAPTVEGAIRLLERQGYRNITNLVRRGENFVGQATDSFGMRVRIVMNARTGDIVGLSAVIPKKK